MEKKLAKPQVRTSTNEVQDSMERAIKLPGTNFNEGFDKPQTECKADKANTLHTTQQKLLVKTRKNDNIHKTIHYTQKYIGKLY